MLLKKFRRAEGTACRTVGGFVSDMFAVSMCLNRDMVFMWLTCDSMEYGYPLVIFYRYHVLLASHLVQSTTTVRKSNLRRLT